MEQILKDDLLLHILLTLFIGFWIFIVIIGTIRKSKEIENQKVRRILCAAVCSLLIVIWVLFFICHELLPISLAYYEYDHSLTAKKTGVVESISQEGKDRICIVIDNTKYVLVYGSSSPYANICKEIRNGNTVQIQFGKDSKYIFDICKLPKRP